MRQRKKYRPLCPFHFLPNLLSFLGGLSGYAQETASAICSCLAEIWRSFVFGVQVSLPKPENVHYFTGGGFSRGETIARLDAVPSLPAERKRKRLPLCAPVEWCAQHKTRAFVSRIIRRNCDAISHAAGRKRGVVSLWSLWRWFCG